ncbi:hypothetical protein GCM10028790_56900 [Micromonospora taraxaci]|uniref:Uncharacterized protein DUF664 n=2 Tax=Micromonospora taraxaci TaxID=1316803 RepID=A0A561W1A1_9ACTN|nr:uncharacterized protein DUF664 [Micromonospora taraxaci]
MERAASLLPRQAHGVEYGGPWLLGREAGPPWNMVDWEADPDWDWQSAAEDSPEQLVTHWQSAAARSRAIVADALADGGLEQLGRFTNSRGESPTLR